MTLPSTVSGVIDARHLTDDAVGAYQTALDAHAARLVCMNDFLEPEVARRLNRFLTSEAEFYRECGLYSVDGPVDPVAFDGADDIDRFFRMNKLAGAKPEHRLSSNALSYLSFRTTLGARNFMTFFEQVFRQPLRSTDDVGVHSMGTGDFLRAHSDANKDRAVAFVIYLSDHWTEEFGGVLEVLDRNGDVTRIVPTFNSIVAFDVLAESLHLITPITAAAGERTRITIGGWYSRVD